VRIPPITFCSGKFERKHFLKIKKKSKQNKNKRKKKGKLGKKNKTKDENVLVIHHSLL